MAKRSLAEYEVSEAVNKSDAAVIHGVVTELSPIKTSKKNTKVKYFTGMMSDSRKAVRMVSFDPSLHEPLEKSKKSSSTVKVTNCQVKASSNEEIELVMTNRSKVEMSPKKIKLEEVMTLPQKNVSMNEVSHVSLNQSIMVHVKIISLSEPVIVSDRKLKKQDIVIGDKTGTCRLVLWEDDVGRLTVNKSYVLKNIHVKQFNQMKYLAVTDNTIVEECEDIGDVASVDSDNTHVIKGELIAVLSADTYHCCINAHCRAKVVPFDEYFGECRKCNATIKLHKCPLMETSVIMMEGEDGVEYKITLFAKEIEHLTNGINEATLMKRLLKVNKLEVTINQQNTAIECKPL